LARRIERTLEKQGMELVDCDVQIVGDWRGIVPATIAVSAAPTLAVNALAPLA
jgi:hypothetical protein